MSGELFRRSAAQDLYESLESFGSCEGGELGALCFKLQYELKHTAQTEGWSIHKPWPKTPEPRETL